MAELLSTVLIDKKAFESNLKVFKSLINKNVILCACIKANAYGHGIIESAKIISKFDKNIWLGVNSAYEAEKIRKAGIKSPIYILGYIPLEQIETAIKADCRFVVYNKEPVLEADKKASKLKKKTKLHIKIETGNNRQGLGGEKMMDLAKLILSKKNLILEGASTHFANIEDTTDHTYAMQQIKKFKNEIAKIEKLGVKILVKHCANTAATILFPETHMDMVRVGIGIYGMWPSNETYVSAISVGKRNIKLTPVATWKTKIAQIKEIPEGEYIGYGCSFKTTKKTKIAIIPVGYYDGYDRKLSNNGYVLIKGKRAQLRGRVCMNIIMADISDISGVKLEDEVVLIGKQGKENISAEQFGMWANTINYEVTTRINEMTSRKTV